ncbi:MAG: sugar phosphate isomerase/epimerase [Bacteroidota bacterium]|nr:sugar phosphate isomerase/epimerase [Bacteroidota bacterium]MDP4217900.1 sugar phosphate isomerase/epimerase [Bacteroidota bacterium]MDP4244316.1 sugar phosphate isomerase/epimerase [Bacteroidota bacterium]MDP4256179.1 sugar phosphate isomerase/epimerase [Bacteroidota bacterium]MDP4257561.1 sugar phosphate isomerase/epimerase [Bacteroidota bacterium]
MKKLTIRCLLACCIACIVYSCHDQSKEATSEVPAGDSTGVTRDWRIGVQMWTFHYVPFVKALEKADSAGVKFIEAFPGQPLGGDMKDSFGIRMSAGSKAEIRKILQSKGIQIVAMGVISPGSIAEWRQYFDLAREFGLSYITAEPLKDQWDALDSLAGVYGIKIAIHDHPRPNPYWHPDSVLAAAKGHPNIGSCADVGHWARNGLDPVECLKKLEGHVFGVHLKDIDSAGNTRANDVIVGTGVIRFPEIFAELKRQHFNGLFSIERENNWYNNVPDVVATINYFHAQVAKLP